MTRKNYDKLTPYELGETGDKEAINYLRSFLETGTINEKRLAASAIQKLSKKFKAEARMVVPLLLNNLNNGSPQVRQYSLKALGEFELNAEEIKKIEFIAQNDDKEYNRLTANNIIQKHSINIPNQRPLTISKEQIPKELKEPKELKVPKFEEAEIGLRGRHLDKYYKILDSALNIIAPGERFTISRMIEESVTDVMINRYGSDWHANEALFWNCYESLRRDFNKEAYVGDIPYFYTMYYMLLNIPKIQMVMLQLMRKKRKDRNIKVLDIGSGVGTVTFALVDLISLLDTLCNIFNQESMFEKVTINSIEGSPDNIAVFNENISYFKVRLNQFSDTSKFEICPPQHGDITNFAIEGEYELIILSNILNEIPYNRRKKLINDLEGNLAPSGDIVIVEPASQKHTTDLNRLKKEIVSFTSLNCIAPCGVSESCTNCWTYQASDLCASSLINYIDKIYQKSMQTKFDDYHNNRLKWGYAILTNDTTKDNCTNLAKAYTSGENAVEVNVLEKKGNSYRICDGTNRGLLVGKDTELGYFHYGDFISIDNIQVEKQDTFTINFHSDASVRHHYANTSKEKHVFAYVEHAHLRYLLKRLWGFDDFREGQVEIIQKALQGNDILGILPTGAGKSICYQLPAMLGNGVSLVVSPLKSLIKDQIANLKSIGFEFVDYIDSSKSPLEKTVTLNRLKAGKLKLLYIAPERLQTTDFQKELRQLLKNTPIDYFIIDEAHCASEWGHDYRPSYLKLRDIVTSLGEASIIAVTATASPRVKEDILEIFKIKEENVVSSHSLDRPEISFQVVLLPVTEDKDSYLTRVLETDLPRIFHEEDINEIHSEGAGIVFTIYAAPKGSNTSSYGTEHVLHIAKQRKINSQLYHSQLKDMERDSVQESFKKNEFPLLVSTKGFGMGIDKPNIRYTIHMCYSNSLEAYYQEAGRAGRDREHAHSIIIARGRKKECIEKNINGYEPPCVDKWVCHYNRVTKCDYGMQAKFISDAYPDAKTIRAELYSFYHMLVKESKGMEEFRFFSFKSKTTAYQTYLFYFQLKGVIVNYATSRYINNGMEFLVIVNPGHFTTVNIDSIIDDIVLRQQSFKKQKYNMLESMWEYTSNKSKCRRQMLMDYLMDNVHYGEEGCKFCDVEGISEERSIAVRTSMKIKKLFNQLQDLMTGSEFDYVKTSALLQKLYAENQHESAKIRAMKHLEDYTDSPVALYFRSIISLRRNTKDAYAINQAVSLVDILISRGETDAATLVVDDLQTIDENIAEQILVSIKIGDIETANKMMGKIKTNSSQEIISKVLVKSRLENLNNLLTRRTSHEPSGTRQAPRKRHQSTRKELG